MRISPHLTWEELACHDGTFYPASWMDRASDLAQVFEDVRIEAGNYPLLVTSAYRTKSWNKKVGGARNSQHLYGRALDLVPIRGVSVEKLFEAAKRVAGYNMRLKGIGLYPTFVHIDIRQSKKLVVWRSL